MITALSVKVPEKTTGVNKLINKIRRDKVESTIKRARGVSVRHITYTSYSGKIKLEKTDRIIGEQRTQLLCDKNLKFPLESGYKRFDCIDFSSRLCTNMALCVLMEYENPEKLKIGIYDKDGNNANFLYYVLEYCSNVTVVTHNTDEYKMVLDRALDELGASAVITESVSEIENCNFVVAPQIIEEQLPLKSDTLVLTAGCPKVHNNGMLYYKYHFKMPNGFDVLKPDALDEEYFCSSLYTLASQYELGSIVPLVCSNYSTSQTTKSLCAYVSRFA